jgi:hypothetical protein
MGGKAQIHAVKDLVSRFLSSPYDLCHPEHSEGSASTLAVLMQPFLEPANEAYAATVHLCCQTQEDSAAPRRIPIQNEERL